MRSNRLGADPDAQAGAGGPTVVLKAGGALKIGDVVSVTAVAQTVNKTAVAADGAFFAGVVVGGGSDFGADPAFHDSASVGLAAVASGKSAVVQVAGIALVVSDDAIAVKARLGIGTNTAGRVITNTTGEQIIGLALDAAGAAGVTIRMLIQPR